LRFVVKLYIFELIHGTVVALAPSELVRIADVRG
jgi:hypothetical protein